MTCRVLGFSRQAFYAWDADPVSDRDWDDAHLVNAILDVHGDDPEFPYPFIADEAAADPSVVEASENRIWRLCRENGVASVISNRTGSGKASGPAVHDDHVQRQFTAAAPNRLLRMRHQEPRTVAYFQRRRGQGLTDRDIIRCLKRHIANEVYRALISPRSAHAPGQLLRQQRQQAGIPITILAAALGVPYQRLRRLEIGTRADPELERLATAALDQVNTRNAA